MMIVSGEWQKFLLKAVGSELHSDQQSHSLKYSQTIRFWRESNTNSLLFLLIWKVKLLKLCANNISFMFKET